MKIYKITDPPIKIYGLNVIDPDNGNFWRLTPDIMEKMPQYNIVGKRCIGGRVRFVTDSATITIRMELKTLNVDRAIPLPGSAGATYTLVLEFNPVLPDMSRRQITMKRTKQLKPNWSNPQSLKR
ncbi:hypothetical protein [Thermoclostridium stercorarium]|uniref:hypothetical protein n=1 Tax=Thermoclostridium stercorarium TaxID=1510 RepID=UPI000AE94F57|nr:hypothetical protein [Thermoclostridium stercorarium]